MESGGNDLKLNQPHSLQKQKYFDKLWIFWEGVSHGGGGVVLL